LLDSKTRETGRVCKLVVAVDLSNMPPMYKYDARISKAFGGSSHACSTYYPQYLGMNVLVNAPLMFRFFYNIMKIFLSRSAMEKTVVCPATGTNTKAASDCPFLAAFGENGPQSVPPFLGGSGSMPDGLRLPNE